MAHEHTPPDRSRLVHLVRHGEVHNPGNRVYARLDGFALSDLGQAQAAAASDHLATAPVSVVLSSPLERAVATATAIAAPHAVGVTIVDELTEWQLIDRWSGHHWADLPHLFPGEVEAYLADPSDLPFNPEPLAEMTERWMNVARQAVAADGTGDIVVVAHQDPVEAGRRALTGRGFEDFHAAKPSHASITTLDTATDPWTQVGYWEPTPTFGR